MDDDVKNTTGMKFKVKSSEIDQRTGRIILPTADEINYIKEKRELEKQSASPTSPTHEANSSINEVVDEPNSSTTSDLQASEPVNRVTPLYSNQTSTLKIPFIAYFLSFLILGSLIWMTWELRQSRLNPLFTVESKDNGDSENLKELKILKEHLGLQADLSSYNFEELSTAVNDANDAIDHIYEELNKMKNIEPEVVPEPVDTEAVEVIQN